MIEGKTIKSIKNFNSEPLHKDIQDNANTKENLSLYFIKTKKSKKSKKALDFAFKMHYF